MHPFDEMKEYVGFSADDAARLRALHTLLGSEEEEIIDAFYQKILDSGARSVLESEEQVERLRLTFRVWLAELLEGPHDYDYFERRERIGRRHVEVGPALPVHANGHGHPAGEAVRRRPPPAR